MNDKIKILFYNLDTAGVNYFRTLTPATELERNHSDVFHVEINNALDFSKQETIEYLKSFNIIHYHRQLIPDTNLMIKVKRELNQLGITFIMDIDDYWHLSKKHPYYPLSVERKLHVPIIENLKIADYITTTTEHFANEIKNVTGKDNVVVLENSVNPEWMKQFQNNWKPDPDGKVRIVYAAGSSHMGDVEQLQGVVNVICNDPELKDKVKIILAGWDTEGTTTDVRFNEEFGDELKKIGLWTQEIVKEINKTRGNVDLMSNKIPQPLKEMYRGRVFEVKERPIKSEESIYLLYEKILTDKHKIIKNQDYLNWLMNFERNVQYPFEGNYARRWTQKANMYAKVLDEADIVIAPLEDNQFNNKKSNLKQVECWSRKLPIVCSDVLPYNVDGKHMENCVLIPNKPNSAKHWHKQLKKLILNADLRKQIGENLYNDFKEKYNLKFVTEKRANFYNEIINNNNKK